jgi:hypothetical protein
MPKRTAASQLTDFENGSMFFQLPSRKVVTFQDETGLCTYSLTFLYLPIVLSCYLSTLLLFGWPPALNFSPCNGRHSKRWHSCQLEQHFGVWEVLRPCNPLRRSSFYVSSSSHLSQVPLLRSSLRLAVSCKWWLCHQARLIVVRKLSAKSVFKGDDPFAVEQMLACLYTSEYWGVWLRPSTWVPGTREQAVEEAVPRNATLNEELDRKKDENIEP